MIEKCGVENSLKIELETIVTTLCTIIPKSMQSFAKCNIILWLFELNLLLHVQCITVQSFSYHQQWLNSFMHITFKVCQQDTVINHSVHSVINSMQISFLGSFECDSLKSSSWQSSCMSFLMSGLAIIKTYFSSSL